VSEPGLSGRIRLVSTAGPLKGRGVVLLLPGPPEFSGGVGGWEATDRPGRRPARWWRGGVEMTQSITGIIQLGVNTGDETVEQRIAMLRRLGTTPGGEDHPTPLRVRGDVADPYSVGGGLWVMQGMSLGERVFRRDGSLRRQAVSVELVDFDDAPTIAPITVRRTRASASRPRVRTITTRARDTLRAIAVRELGSVSAWQRIREWNPRLFKGTRPVGPDEPLRAGLRVTIK
jgi:phage protein U